MNTYKLKYTEMYAPHSNPDPPSQNRCWRGIWTTLFYYKYITEQIIPYHLSVITIKEIPWLENLASFGKNIQNVIYMGTRCNKKDMLSDVEMSLIIKNNVHMIRSRIQSKL